MVLHLARNAPYPLGPPAVDPCKASFVVAVEETGGDAFELGGGGGREYFTEWYLAREQKVSAVSLGHERSAQPRLIRSLAPSRVCVGRHSYLIEVVSYQSGQSSADSV
jgi:hypothetical protein